VVFPSVNKGGQTSGFHFAFLKNQNKISRTPEEQKYAQLKIVNYSKGQ
jgi:hypothetical protein